ncbi:UpxY family transcription antiterminator [Cloacibacterium normanense]|uniref:UpxY family transcription antiterminator n=1 Tax=Cloacibacterium normanense TaxID=237258 RepID=UPI0035AE1E0F
MNWYALYTKPRNEKKVEEQLHKMGLEVFCPKVSVVKQWSDRKKKVSQPLIPSYVFIKIKEQERDLVFSVSGVVRYLFFLGKPAIIKESEINAMKETLNHDFKEVGVMDLEKGQKFTIEEGTFKGQEATFLEQKGNKIILRLESLGIKLILEK